MASITFRCLFSNIRAASNLLAPKAKPIIDVQRFRHIKAIPTPKPGQGKQYRRTVHYPEDGVYTIRPLEVTNLAGRDPVTGRVVANGIGGGIKYKYHWVKYQRDGPSEGPPQVEKVLKIMKSRCRTADIALVGVGSELKYILATENMKAGDLIKTSRVIPKNPVRANDGDAYPLGALPTGTKIHCLEVRPGRNAHKILAAGTFGTIMRKFDQYVVVQMPTRCEIAYHETCMATVGRVSNVDHADTPIGTPQKNRELGNRPRSGLWQRKTGRHGRKIRKLPAMRIFPPIREANPETIVMTLPAFKYH